MAGPIAYLQAALAFAGTVRDHHRGQLPSSELRFILELTPGAQIADVQSRLQQLVSPDQFLIESLDLGDAAAGRFHVLRFPTLERVFPQAELFDLGYALADSLGLESCEPDLGADVFIDPAPPEAGPVIEANFLASLCWSTNEPPADVRWALRHTGLDLAHQSSRGQGILVGHLDTGITRHAELGGGMFDMERAANVLDGGTDPTDPLAEHMVNPGHGTATCSVLASRVQGELTGAAPECRIVPIRCIDSVKVFNTAPIVAAISHAVRSGCHVISMSLGGIPGRALRAAIRNAVEHDVIVVAAAGNCVRKVVWPAHYREVIATGGVGPSNRPWKGSSRGNRVTLSAPAEHVYRAKITSADTDATRVEASQGTSYATALIAGAAAVWLSHHGRNAVIQEARRRGLTVAQLYATALKATVHRPEDWNEDLGAGVLDANRLLSLPLESIPYATAEAVATEDDDLEVLLQEAFGAAPVDPAFDAKRFETELAAIALRQARLDPQLRHLAPEAKWEGTRPSARLAAAVAGSSDPRLGRFGESAQASVSRPLLPPPSDADARQAVRLLGKAEETALESAVPSQVMDAARAYLDGDEGAKLIDSTERYIAASNAPQPIKKAIHEYVHTFHRELKQRGIIRSRDAQMGLEALVLMKGRPALRIKDGNVDEHDPRAEQWGYAIHYLKANSPFATRVGAVGRIDLNGLHVGTGWVVGEELILTNRHVLQNIAYPAPTRNHPRQWVLKQPACTIDFQEEPTPHSRSHKFEIVSVEEAGPLFIDPDLLDFTKPDFALLRVRGWSLAGDRALPPPLDLLNHDTPLASHAEIAVIGYPARPIKIPGNGDEAIDLEGLERLQALFAADYGSKYFSPGRITPPRRFAAEAAPHTASHDATTLGGSSGSLIASIDAPMKAVGLHFAGAWREENYAHSLAMLKRQGYLQHTGLNWVN